MRHRSQASPAIVRTVQPRVEPPHVIDPELRLHRASNGLLESHPELSAGAALWNWQKFAFIAVAVALLAGTVVLPRQTLAMLLAILALPFLCVVSLRAVALWTLATTPAASRDLSLQIDPLLPRYTVLAPLFREANVVPALIAALEAIDYPPDRLEIFLILEGIDHETRAAVAASLLPAHMSVVVVPDGTPRTKPRALNYAMQAATGDYIVVYDAEDIPDPGQLRAALAMLNDPRRRIGCVQARLDIYNPMDSLLTRQFTIEYAALFDALLPALERLDLPVPLGGTSNHFPRAVLENIGGWDPYNVTEDADLGIRLARAGYAVRILDSSTGEEAPQKFLAWRNQRTRWLKGWMQTYLVHMREPGRLWRELGGRRFAGLQVLMGGLILSALMHPWFYVFAAADLWHGFDFTAGNNLWGQGLWWLGVINLIAGYLTAVALGAYSVARRRKFGLAMHSVLMPFYWLAISFAAYRALWQLVKAPYLWEKTEHTARLVGASTK